MAGNRTLKLSILADVDNLRKGLNQADNDVEGSSKKLGNWSGKAKLAFAAAAASAAAYAGKLAIDGVKAAIEDEAAQLRLANALKNVTGATDKQIASAESWILKTSLATGVADDKLRPALERLTRSTKSVEEAQNLTNLALDIAAAKNIDVETAANALAKANDGQVGALKKLGITLGDNADNLKEYNALQKKVEKAQLDANLALQLYGPSSKEYRSASEKVKEATAAANEVAMKGIDVFGELGKEFSGAASEAANTFQGKMNRLKIAFDEAKETVGSFILDAITPIVGYITDKVVPAVGTFIESIGGKEGLKSAFNDYVDFAKKLFGPAIEAIKDVFDRIKKVVIENKDEFQALFNFLKNFVAPFFGGVLKLAIQGIGLAIETAVKNIAFFIDKFEKAYEAVKKFVDFLKNNPITKGLNNLFNSPSSISQSNVPNVPQNMGNPNIRNTGAPVNNITVNGAIDPISTARQIANILNIEATQSGSFKSLGGNLAYQA